MLNFIYGLNDKLLRVEEMLPKKIRAFFLPFLTILFIAVILIAIPSPETEASNVFKPVIIYSDKETVNVPPEGVIGSYVSAGELVDLCANNTAREVTCSGYIAGIIDYHHLMRTMGQKPPVSFCIPKNIKMDRITNVVLNYMTAHPANDAFVASPAVSVALSKEFPCKRKKSRKIRR